MRNPNGYGSVFKLSGNRRKPYVARKTKGWDSRGYPIYQVIGYYATKKEGLLALAEFNKNPWDMSKDLTLSELYTIFMRNAKLSQSQERAFKYVYKYLESLYNVKYREIKLLQMQACIDNCNAGYSTQSHIKGLFKHLDKKALEFDIPIKKFASELVTDKMVTKKEARIFTYEEISALWNDFDTTCQYILVLLYTGMRIGELEIMELDGDFIRTGIKTESSKNRLIPIHSAIKPFIYNNPNPKSHNLRRKFNLKMAELGMEHNPHECRHTFRSEMDRLNANEKCVNLIMGHVFANDTGKNIYTHKSKEELIETIELLSYNQQLEPY